jgi:polar amino acid transport system substrate-binding protein
MKYIKLWCFYLIFNASFFYWVPKAIAAELEQIIARGELIVGVKDNLPPLSFEQQGSLVGLEIDIAKKIATEIFGDVEAIQLQPVENQDRLKVVIDRKVDLTIARVTFTEARSRVVAFSPYYYLDGTGIVTKKTVNSYQDLALDRVAVLQNSSTIAVIRYYLPQAELVPVSSYQEALASIEAGLADAFAADVSVLTGWVQEYPQYNLLDDKLSTAALCIVMPKGLQYRKLRDRINEIVEELQESGWLEERINYWGLPQ